MVIKAIAKHLLLLLVITGLAFGQVKRGRNEGTINIPASNVIGNGNILLYGAMSGTVDRLEARAHPWAGLNLGIANMLQLSGKMSMIDFRRPGGMEARVQMTMPDNDRLRFFGASISGELYLSTEIDTLSGTAYSGRPDYNAYVRPSLTVDFDWIARSRNFPLKTYFMVGMADNPDVLFMYSQLALRLGFEMKLEKNSYALDIGAGLYKEKSRPLEGFNGDAGFAQQRIWVEPSVRYRFFNRYSAILAVRVLALQWEKTVRPINAEYLKVSTMLEIPVVFKETNSEAIRTMIFVEHRKNVEKDRNDYSGAKKEVIPDSLRIKIEGLDLELTPDESEEQMLKRREEIQQKMEEIERLLEDME